MNVHEFNLHVSHLLHFQDFLKIKSSENVATAKFFSFAIKKTDPNV